MLDVRIITKAPVCHGGFGPGVGNAVAVRKEPIVGLVGMPSVPCISGNSIRGQVRRYVMRDLFRRAGLGVGSLEGKSWDLLYAGLANGGHLTGAEKSPSPNDVRDLRSQLPPLSVFGSALYRFLLPGRVRFGFAWPICKETVEVGLVEPHDDFEVPFAGDLVTEVGFARHIDREQQSPKKTGVSPMPVMVEAIAVGVVLCQVVRFLPEVTEIERSCVAWGLSQISNVGGKSASGLGAVDLEHNGDLDPYTEWLEGADDLRGRLVSLSERF
jgi:hypothetical protein